jgi:FAD/FMN-containing dehydrogenase
MVAQRPLHAVLPYHARVATPDPLVSALADIVGAQHVLVDPDVTASYETDWTGRWSGRARCVVRPKTSYEVAQVLQACAAHAAAVVPQGGNTGLVGGSVPREGDVLLSLARFDEIGDVRPDSGTIIVGAGVTLGALQRHLAGSGWRFGVDLASRDSATIGGMVATNAGGIHVLRHGMMRRQVLGVIAVLADGREVRPGWHGLEKDNTGYDLTGLLVGSEGTLGIVTHVWLRLAPVPRHRVCALVGLDTMGQAIQLLRRLRPLPSLEAVEYMTGHGVDIVARHAGLPLPFDPLPEVLLLIECAADHDPSDELARILRDMLHVAVGVEREERERLWAYRERHTEALNALGVPLKFDVSIPTVFLDEFVDEVTHLLEAHHPIAAVVVFGHLADGNIHVNIVDPTMSEEEAAEIVLGEVTRIEGGISAEHGIGRAKRDWLPRARPPAELDAMRAIKHALDPGNLLNPGVLFPEA